MFMGRGREGERGREPGVGEACRIVNLVAHRRLSRKPSEARAPFASEREKKKSVIMPHIDERRWLAPLRL